MKKRRSCQCGYAETHYKFKLPWAPLWKPWPEVFVDAPSFAIPGATIPFWLVIKDAHDFPIKVQEIVWTCLHVPSKTRTQGVIPLDLMVESAFQFLPLEVEQSSEPGTYLFDFKISISNSKGKQREILNTNYRGIPSRSLTVERLQEVLPYPKGWFAGDLHCHTYVSSDQVEFGGDLQAMTQAAACVGLDFWSPTDHSYDFAYKSDTYLEAIDPMVQWQAMNQEINDLPRGLPTVIRGEEVSAGNHLGQNVHFLVIGESQFFPGLGDGGRRWFNNQPDLGIDEITHKIQEGACFAAHPRVRLNPVEALLLNRGRWHQEDIHPGLHGLQFWNGNEDLSFREGRAFWVQQLLKGNYLLPIAGNDAHGDLNRSVGVKWPLFSLWTSQNHVFGQVRTLFPAQTSNQQDLVQAMRGKECCITNGPWVGFDIESNTVQYQSSSDYGSIQKLNVFGGQTGEAKERVLHTGKADRMTGTLKIELQNCEYVRIEARTEKGHLAMSSAYSILTR